MGRPFTSSERFETSGLRPVSFSSTAPVPFRVGSEQFQCLFFFSFFFFFLGFFKWLFPSRFVAVGNAFQSSLRAVFEHLKKKVITLQFQQCFQSGFRALLELFHSSSRCQFRYSFITFPSSFSVKSFVIFSQYFEPASFCSFVSFSEYFQSIFRALWQNLF